MLYKPRAQTGSDSWQPALSGQFAVFEGNRRSVISLRAMVKAAASPLRPRVGLPVFTEHKVAAAKLPLRL